jgi:uncharacterized membrane protein YbhN (UPF0104 family)
MSAAAAAPRPWWGWALRGAGLVAAGISLYVLAPTLLSLVAAWPDLKTLHLGWLAAAVGFEVMSFVALWELWRVVLRTPSWFAVGTAQLAGNALGSLFPGGGAAAGACSYRLLVRSGVDGGTVATGMAASLLATTATVLFLPVLAVPALLGGLTAPTRLVRTAYVGAAVFAGVAGLGAAALWWDAPLRSAGRAVAWVLTRLGRPPTGDVPARLLAQRDAVRTAFGARRFAGLLGAVGKWGFDYVALTCCLAAVGSRPAPALVLLAYTAAALLGMIPVTPGGLGFVEAGLVGTLTLAGVGAHEATVATLAYRLIGFWLPLPAGAVAALLHRRRYAADA